MDFPFQGLLSPGMGLDDPLNSAKSLGGTRPSVSSFGGLLDPKWDGLEMSENIEDRRGNSPYHAILPYISYLLTGGGPGFTLEDYHQMIRHPLTPFSRPPTFEDRWLGEPSQQMQKDFGVK